MESIFDQIPAAVFVTNAGGGILAVNDTAATMLGYAPRELVGRNIADLTHPEDVVHRRSLVLGQDARLGRRRMLHQDGEYRATDEKARTLDDGRIVSVFNEVTHEDTEQLRFVGNAVPALLCYADAQARYVWVNEGYRRWFGISPERVRGLHVSEVVGPLAWASIRSYVERALGGEEVTYTQRLLFGTGTPRDICATYVPHLGGGGRVRGFVGHISDVSELKATEQGLRRSERLLEQSQSTAHVGSWDVALDQPTEVSAVRWSDEHYRIFGYEPRAIKPTRADFFDAVHPEDRDAVRSMSNASIARGEPVEKEFRIVHPDGTVRLVHSWTRFEHDQEGRPIRMLGTCQDITERKQAEHEVRRAREDLQRSLEDLREADRRKDEFLAMLSHELRNPLAPILSAVEMLERTGPGDEARISGYRTVIARQVQHMKRLLDDLLDVSRVSQGKIQLRKEQLELGALLLEAVELSRSMIVEKRQELTVRLQPGPLTLDADPTRLVQVFANLVNNASKYTDGGGRISITVSAEAGEAVVSVKDDGMGMRPELLMQAFDLFVQETRSLDRAQGGLGIGLTMVRTLVKLHGGSVQAFSDGPGRGSELVVRLPLSRQIEALSPGPPQTATRPLHRPLRVLVVDDNEDAAQALGQLLEMLGHQVTVAYDGPGALAAANDVPPELVLLDIGLPSMDGYAVAAHLRDAGHHRASVVALTGYGQDEHLRRSSAASFDHHLVKPVDFATVRGIIDELLAASGETSS